MDKVNYVLCKKNEEEGYTIAKIYESPTYKKIDLDPMEAYDKIIIQNIHNFPELFDIKKPEKPEFCGPFRKVMCRIDECDFCGVRKTFEEIHQEYTDLANHMGYFYCDECKELMIEGLKDTGVRSIWYIRERHHKQKSRCMVWIERTRRNEQGQRINYGPIAFEKWEIMGWHATMLEDKSDSVIKPHIICEGSGFYKAVPVEIILKLNPEDDIEYDPNQDSKYTIAESDS